MKRYLLVDCMSDYTELANSKRITELLIEELSQDISNNSDEKRIVEGNIEILKKLALNVMTFEEIEKELGSYSFKIIDLLKLQRDLDDIKQYFDTKKELQFVGKIDEIINRINMEVN